MATMEEKMGALTTLMQEGILTAEEFASVVAVLNGKSNEAIPAKEKSPLEEQYDYVFTNYIVNSFKSPASCKWPELKSDMIKVGSMKIAGILTECTYIDTYIDAPNSYGTMLRKSLRLILDEDGKITRALEKPDSSGGTLLGAIGYAFIKNDWFDIVKW